VINPWVLLAVGVLWLASCGSSYVWGHRAASNASKAAQATATAKLIQQHNENAVVDMQAAVEAEGQRQQTRIEYRDRETTIERIVRENPNDCRIADPAYRVLLDSINAANSKASAKREPVPAPAAAGIPEGR